MNNQWGLDEDYFKRKLKLVLRDIGNYKPHELARELARLSRTADDKVIQEPEFTGNHQERNV